MPKAAVLLTAVFLPLTFFWSHKPVVKPTPVAAHVLVSTAPSPITSPSPIPSPTIKPTPTSTPTATPIPTPKPSPTPTLVPTATPQPVSNQGSLMSQINSYRSSKGLASFSEDSNTCNFAQTRAGEISSSFNHDGFNNRISSHTLPYPSYSHVTENIAMNSNSGDVVPMWINSPGHQANLLAGDKYACVRSSGNYYAFESWNP